MSGSKDITGQPLWIGQTVIAAKGYKGNTRLYPAVVEEIGEDRVYIRFIETNIKVCRFCNDVIIINP